LLDLRWFTCKSIKFKRYAVVIVSNQAVKAAALKNWKDMIPLIGETVRSYSSSAGIEYLESVL
jgi:hypothetical protein